MKKKKIIIFKRVVFLSGLFLIFIASNLVAEEASIILDSDATDSSFSIRNMSGTELARFYGSGDLAFGGDLVFAKWNNERYLLSDNIRCGEGYVKGLSASNNSLYIYGMHGIGNGGYGNIHMAVNSDSNYYLNALVIDSNGYVGLDTDSPAYRLDVRGDIRANAFIDNSPIYMGNDALSQIRNIRAEFGTVGKDGWGKVDHSSLPIGVRVVKKERVLVRKTDRADIKANVVSVKDKSKMKTAYKESTKVVEARDLGAMQQVMIRGMQELIDKMEILEKRVAELESKSKKNINKN